MRMSAKSTHRFTVVCAYFCVSYAGSFRRMWTFMELLMQGSSFSYATSSKLAIGYNRDQATYDHQYFHIHLGIPTLLEVNMVNFMTNYAQSNEINGYGGGGLWKRLLGRLTFTQNNFDLVYFRPYGTSCLTKAGDSRIPHLY